VLERKRWNTCRTQRRSLGRELKSYLDCVGHQRILFV
jgi:hypothetical protein